MAVGNTTTVDETYGSAYRENETVTAGGTTLSEGTDYEWYPSNQSVYWYGTTNVSDGGTASITYSFDHKPETARRSIGTISSAFSIGAVAVITLVASVILGLVGGFGGSRGRRR
ncbi:hypothetical protein GCM10009066_17460 [Halarchaeum salinum]|uniref:DUF3592 domain-containing protein n=2 Tax=Halarchaeum salinum TaxID=489912 RepID=A0AAV3S979_9EURY